jgi:Tol biopolymer transport system component
LLRSEEFSGFTRGIMTAHTWSADGEAFAVGVHLRTPQGRRLEALYVGRSGEAEIRPVFTSPQVAPFYLYWSPDGDEISFIGGDGSGALYLYVVDTETMEAQVAHRGSSSLYWTWAQDGGSIITHTGGGLDEGQGTLRVHRRAGESFDSSVLTMRERSSGRFQVPDVSDSGERIAVVLRNQYGSNTLAVLAPDGTLLRRVTDFTGAASLSWSPDGRYLAYVEGARRFGGGVVGTLRVVDTERVDQVVRSQERRYLADGLPAQSGADGLPAQGGAEGRSGESAFAAHLTSLVQAEGESEPTRVLSYAWSPDSSRILYFEPRYINTGGDLDILMEASLLDAATGESEILGSFRPAPEFLRRILPFYDQYARSSTVWSPSGRRIVFNGLNEAGRQAVFVIDLENREAGAQEISEGVVPLWRPAP